MLQPFTSVPRHNCVNCTFDDNTGPFDVVVADGVPPYRSHRSACHTWQLKEVKIIFYPMFPLFLKQHCFLRVPSLRPFVLPVRATCRWRLLWGFAGMMLTGENEVLGAKPAPLPLCVQQISHGLTWDRTRDIALRNRRINAWATEERSASKNIQNALLTS